MSAHDTFLDKIQVVLDSRAREGARSPFSTTVTAGDSKLVQFLKKSFASYEARNWGIPGEVLTRAECDRRGRDFGPGRGGLSPAEYHDYARALRAAQALDRDPDTAGLVQDMAQDMIRLYQELEPLSHEFREHSNGRVDAVYGWFEEDPSAPSRKRYVPGITTLHPDELAAQEAAAQEAARGSRYGHSYRSEYRAPWQLAWLDPWVQKGPRSVSVMTPLWLKNWTESRFAWTLSFPPFSRLNQVKSARRREAKQPGSPTHKLMYHGTEFLKLINRMERLLIQEHGRVFNERMNSVAAQNQILGFKIGPRIPFRGLKNRPDSAENIFLFYNLLRFSHPAVLQCAKDHFDFRHIGAGWTEFINPFYQTAVAEYSVGYRPENPDGENLLEILQEHGPDDPRIPDVLRNSLNDMKRSFIEGERQTAFESLVRQATTLDNSMAGCYVFRSILSGLHLPEFGKALLHLVEAQISLLGNDTKSIETSLEMLSSSSSEMSNMVKCIIENYYRGYEASNLLGLQTSAVSYYEGDHQYSLSIAARRYPDEVVLMLDRTQTALTILSEWLEIPDLGYEAQIPEEWENKLVDLDTFKIDAVHGYGGIGKGMLLNEANDFWGMNFLLRKLIEMKKIEAQLKAPASNENTSYARDWIQLSAILAAGLWARLPFLARQNCPLSPNLIEKFNTFFTTDPLPSNATWDVAIDRIYRNIFDGTREDLRNPEHSIQFPDLGPGTPHFLFSPELTPAPGVSILQGNPTFCELDSKWQPKKDAQGQIIFREIEGYGYEPAVIGHLRDNKPLTFMQDQDGKNVLRYYKWSREKTREVYELLRQKGSRTNWLGEFNSREISPTSVIPMFDARHPDNPGKIAIGYTPGMGFTPRPPLMMIGDTHNTLEMNPILDGYHAVLRMTSASDLMMGDPDLEDPAAIRSHTPDFATLPRNSAGEFILKYARRGAIDINGNFITVPIFTAKMIAQFRAAFTANQNRLHAAMRETVTSEVSLASSFTQILNAALSKIPEVIRRVRRDVHGDETASSYAGREAVRATPSPNFPGQTQTTDAPARAFIGRGQRFLPTGTTYMRRLSDSDPVAWMQSNRTVGTETIQAVLDRKYVPVAKALGIDPGELRLYAVVPPHADPSARSGQWDGVPLEALFSMYPNLARGGR